MIKTQQGGRAIKLNGLSNHNQDTKTQQAGVLLLGITRLLWLSCSPGHPGSYSQEVGAGVKAGTAPEQAGASEGQLSPPQRLARLLIVNCLQKVIA